MTFEGPKTPMDMPYLLQGGDKQGDNSLVAPTPPMTSTYNPSWPQTSGQASALAPLQSREEYDGLAHGEVYQDPQGVLRTKNVFSGAPMGHKSPWAMDAVFGAPPKPPMASDGTPMVNVAPVAAEPIAGPNDPPASKVAELRPWHPSRPLATMR